MIALAAGAAGAALSIFKLFQAIRKRAAKQRPKNSPKKNAADSFSRHPANAEAPPGAAAHCAPTGSTDTARAGTADRGNSGVLSGGGGGAASATSTASTLGISGPIPQLRSGALVVFRDARGQGVVVHPSGNGEWWDLTSTCAANGVLRLRVADLSYSCAESVFLVEEAPGGQLAFRAIG